MSFTIPTSIVDEFVLREGDKVITAVKKLPFCPVAEPQFVRAYERERVLSGALVVETSDLVAVLISDMQGVVRCEVGRVVKIHVKRPGRGAYDLFGEPNCLVEDGSFLSGFIANLRLYQEGAEPSVWVAGRPLHTESTCIKTGVATHRATGRETSRRLTECFPKVPVDFDGIPLFKVSVEIWTRYTDKALANIRELIENSD